jgi:hypothetical protein
VPVAPPIIPGGQVRIMVIFFTHSCTSVTGSAMR